MLAPKKEYQEFDTGIDGIKGIEGALCGLPRKEIAVLVDGAQWHVVSGQIESQRRIVECRSGIKVEVYSPALRVMKPVPRKQLSVKQRKALIKVKRPVLEQLFPGYFFVRFDRRDDRWQDIFRLIGIYGLVCEGDAPVAMPDRYIESLRAKEVNGAVPGKIDAKQFAYDIGETVRLTDGPFIGFNAVIEAMPTKPIEELDEDCRVSLLVSLFGRQCHVSTPISGFEKV